jgi:putative transposase
VVGPLRSGAVYSPSRGAIPLYRYRKYQKTKSEERIDRVIALAQQLGLPRAAVAGEADMLRAPLERPTTVPRQPFPEPVEETAFQTVLAAKRAIADLLSRPLAKLSPEDLAFINALLSETLDRRAVIGKVCQRFGLPPREI